jgi:RHS repeat-associated protein
MKELFSHCPNSALGVATNETVTLGGTVSTLTRGVDNRHRLAALRVGNAPPVQYGYDVENRLSTVSNAAFVAEYAYTSDGWDAGYGITLTNGVVLARELTRDPYCRSLITAITNRVDGVAVNPLAYGYDKLNRVTSRNNDTFSYNARSEITAASVHSNAFTYAYDSIGNHTTASVNADTTAYTANNLNQYATIDAITPSYDADGNMLTNGVWSYAYDAENRLTVAYSNNVCVVSNAYDHMSRRVLKWTPCHTTTFVYDGWLPILEIVATSSEVATNAYVWGKDLSGTMQGAGGVGGMLAVSLNGSWYFPFYDNNGNVTAYVGESGSVVAEYVYDAFGATIVQSGSMADAFAHRFSTKYYDAETGMYDYGRRFYSPSLHRWLNCDPIEEEGGFNLYAFCGNDGVNGVDLLGMAKLLVYFVGDSLTLADGTLSNKVPFDGYSKKLIELLRNKFPQHVFERTQLGAPGARFEDVLAGKLDPKFGDRKSTSEKLNKCEGVIIPFLFGINSLARNNNMTYEQLFEASTHSALSWLDLRDNTIKAIPSNRQAIMVAMTLPSLTQEAGSRFNAHLPAWNVSISLLNNYILRTGAPTRNGLQYTTLNLAKTVRKAKFKGSGRIYDYDLFLIGGHLNDGLHFTDEGNDYIANKVFKTIKPWVEENFK